VGGAQRSGCAERPQDGIDLWTRLLGREIGYSGDDMDAFDEQIRKRAPS
jgi:hypothetical protein